MEKRINEIIEKFKSALQDFFDGEDKSLEEAETYFGTYLSGIVTSLLGFYYETLDQRLLENKALRKKEGLLVERHGDTRSILTTLGQVDYQRTYYRTREKAYCYPIDEIVGVGAWQRLSVSVNEKLVTSACEHSYAKSAQEVTAGRVSRQSVMRKIRQSQAVDMPSTSVQKVDVLHIDADEDHVTLCGGKQTIVPLISVYEGIEKTNQRGQCIQVFHISRYGKTSEQLWEEALTQIEKRYDISQAKVYLHGDGASWIHTGVEYLPNCVLVLDRHHKNKALRQALCLLEEKSKKVYREKIFHAWRSGDKEQFQSLSAEIVSHGDNEQNVVANKLKYLSNHFEAIHICYTDAEATNGGASEPHVSHILSSRLSSRPMAWSRQTLEHFAPILAAKRFSFNKTFTPSCPLTKDKEKTKKLKAVPFSLGLPDPDLVVSLPARSGKVTPLFNALRFL